MKEGTGGKEEEKLLVCCQVRLRFGKVKYPRYVNTEEIIKLITGQRKLVSIQSQVEVLTFVFYCGLM